MEARLAEAPGLELVGRRENTREMHFDHVCKARVSCDQPLDGFEQVDM